MTKRKSLETTLYWFRSDLRLFDSHALYRASFTDAPIIGLFILSPQEYKSHDWASIKLEFLLNNLRALKKECKDMGIPLIILLENNCRNVPNRVKDLALEVSASSVFWNIEYEVDEGRRDEKTLSLLSDHGIKGQSLHDQCVLAPGTVVSKEGKSYSVFTPFKKALILALQKDKNLLNLYHAPKKQKKEDIEDFIWDMSHQSQIPESVEELGFITKKLEVALNKEWPAGRVEAEKRLEAYLTNRGRDYQVARDFPSQDGTSRLSPYLAIGVISARKCVFDAFKANYSKLDSGNLGLMYIIYI